MSQERVARRKDLMMRIALGDEDAAQELAEMDEPAESPLALPSATPERRACIERLVDSMRIRENLSQAQQQNARARLAQCSDEQLGAWDTQFFQDAVQRFEAEHQTTLTHGETEPAKRNFAGPRDERLAKKHPDWSHYRRFAEIGRQLEEHESDEAESHRVVQDMIRRQRQRGMPKSYVEERLDEESGSSPDYDQMRAAEADYEAHTAESVLDVMAERLKGPLDRGRQVQALAAERRDRGGR